jgi:hypothetical protein
VNKVDGVYGIMLRGTPKLSKSTRRMALLIGEMMIEEAEKLDASDPRRTANVLTLTAEHDDLEAAPSEKLNDSHVYRAARSRVAAGPMEVSP